MLDQITTGLDGDYDDVLFGWYSASVEDEFGLPVGRIIFDDNNGTVHCFELREVDDSVDD